MDDYDIPPELLDVVLASAGRVEEQKPAKPIPKPATANVWLFQANPSIYNIDQALSELDELTWVVRQYKSDIRTGDRVYIWRAGADAGVVATATVEDDPAETAPAADDPYTLKPEAFSKSELRVRLRIDTALPEAVRRSDLLEHAVLKSLEVITFANATNFRVSPEQDEALQTLVTGFRIPTLRTAIEERVFLPRDWLQEAVDMLADKGQVVFYGPPGTGKTFVALALAEELTRDGGDFRIVQFHPSYSYEDFVGGFRPVEDDGAHGVRYQRTNGPLRELAAAASADPRHPYVLIIDEINRGNIPKIFGELLFLLEYRAEGRAASVLAGGAVQPSAEPVRDRDDEHGGPIDRARRRRAAPPLLLLRVHSAGRAGAVRPGQVAEALPARRRGRPTCSRRSTKRSPTTRSRSVRRTS